MLSIAALVTIFATGLTSTVVAAPASAAAGYVGITSGTDAASWRDVVIAPMTVGEPYNDSVQVPAGWGGYFNESGNLLPSGIDAALGADGTILLYGTPTTADSAASFYLTLAGSDGAFFQIDFTGVVVDGGLPATVTTVSSPDVSPYSAVSFESTVTGAAPTGTVTFLLNGNPVATVALVNGVATYTEGVASGYIGNDCTLVARYNGDEANAASDSAADSVYIYASNSVSGSVSQNGSPLETTVELVDSYGDLVTSTATTGGAFTLAPAVPVTVADAVTMYYVRAVVGAGYVYYSTSGAVGAPNVTTTGGATLTHPTNWTTTLPIYVNVAPVWSESSLAQPRLGSAYSDGVTATGTATLAYSVSAGVLPAGLTLDSVTGSITGTPTDQVPQTFTLRAANAYGAVTATFTLTPGDAGVAPTFTDESLATPEEGTAYVDAVAAEGDATIVYASDPLPAGLVLDPSTGSITGTPTTPGPFSVEITATNDFGSDTFTWTGVVTAAPELTLELNFAAGTKLGDASTEISADGLRVGSTYTLDLHSDPIRLYTGIVDATGGFTWVVSLPANTPVGAHELVLTGVAPDGTVMTARAWFTLLANGTIGAVSYSGPFLLAFSGSDPLLLVGVAGALIVAGFILQRRRRTTSVQHY